jgi:hypothetical protein
VVLLYPNQAPKSVGKIRIRDEIGRRSWFDAELQRPWDNIHGRAQESAVAEEGVERTDKDDGIFPTSDMYQKTVLVFRPVQRIIWIGTRDRKQSLPIHGIIALDRFQIDRSGDRLLVRVGMNFTDHL